MFVAILSLCTIWFESILNMIWNVLDVWWGGGALKYNFTFFVQVYFSLIGHTNNSMIAKGSTCDGARESRSVQRGGHTEQSDEANDGAS